MTEPSTPVPTGKEAEADRVVNRYVRWTAASGLIPLPLVDLAAVTAFQVKMLSSLSKVYEIPFSKHRGKSLLAALLGGILPTELAWGGLGTVIKMVPVVGGIAGVLTMPAFAGASTYAVGKVFIQHFESGGTFLDFDPSSVKDYFATQFREGKEMLGRRDDEKRPSKSATA